MCELKSRRRLSPHFLMKQVGQSPSPIAPFAGPGDGVKSRVTSPTRAALWVCQVAGPDYSRRYRYPRELQDLRLVASAADL
jgi:hypothetical protein